MDKTSIGDRVSLAKQRATSWGEGLAVLLFISATFSHRDLRAYWPGARRSWGCMAAFSWLSSSMSSPP